MRWFSFTLTALIICWSTTAEGSVPELWKKTAFAYEAQHATLQTTLLAFAKTFGVKLKMGKVSGVVNGKLRSDSASAYLDRLALEYQFLWFVYNGTLYVSPLEDQTSLRLDVSEDAVADLKEALTHIGLLDKRFGWGELPDEGVVIISGPKRYVEFVKKLAKKKKKGEEKLEIMMFPLKYAQADDRTIKYRNQSIVIPGIASMLSGLLENKKKVPVAPDFSHMTVADTLQAFDSMRESTQQRAQQQIDQHTMTQSQFNQQRNTNPPKSSKITADIRNNAILIRDDIDKRQMYQDLINKLDQPRDVIEIDAIILDIDRSKLDELGVNWHIGSGNTEASFNASGADPFLATGSSATILIQDFNHFFAQIRALETDGDASLIANPSILTIENQPAVIDFNHTAFIKNTGERVANVTSLTAGTSLQVVPRLIDDENSHLIQLSLDIEDGNIEYKVNQSTPTVQKGTISTQAIVQAQHSLVIGGFKVEKKNQQYQKVPLLGDIPGLGKLFTYSSKNQSKRERLFIITPRIVGNETNPLEYISANGRAPLAKTLEQQQERHRYGFSREDIEKSFADLSHFYIPAGFTQEKPPVELGYYCQKQAQLIFNHQKLQWYTHQGSPEDRHDLNVDPANSSFLKDHPRTNYALLVGAIHNNSTSPVRFDEASCANRDTLAVTIRPNARLAPGGSAEVMMAVRLPKLNRTQRAPLIRTSQILHP